MMEIAELKNHCAEMNKLKQKHTKLKEDAATVWKEFLKMKSAALEVLDAHELDNFDTGFGKIIKNVKRAVSIEDKVAFWNWLKRCNVFEDYVTISVATATKIYNESFEEAQETKDVAFLRDGIPGLTKPKSFYDITLKGFKK